jgi:hypothetical protein
LPYGEGLIVNIPLPENEVAQVVEDVAQNGVIRGTKEYNNDEFVKGAKAATSSRLFPAWNESGKVFYEVREQAPDPCQSVIATGSDSEKRTVRPRSATVIRRSTRTVSTCWKLRNSPRCADWR